MALKEVLNTSNAAQFKFDTIGTRLQGYLVASEEFVLNGKNVKKHIFSTPKGLVGVLGNFMLDQGIANIINQHGLGVFVVITYVENQKLKMGKSMKVFKIQYDEEDRLDVGSSNLADEPVADEDYADAEAAAPSEEELTDETDIEEPQSTAALPPSKKATAPATVSKDAQSRVQNVLSRRTAR